VRDPAVPLSETKIDKPIEEPTLNGTQLAALYRKYTGRRVIVAAAAVAAEFSFVQDASPEDPLTYGQAAELLKKAASVENFVFVPDEKTPNLDILNVAARPSGTGYDVLNENDPLPEGDAVVTYVMTFKHIKPEVAAQAFTQIVGAFGTYGSIAPLNGSVVITENTSLIRRLIKLKAEIDTETEVRTRFIHVKYSDVTELAATLNDLLNAQQQAQKSAAVQRAAAPAAPTAPTAPVTPGGAPVQNTAVVTGGASTSIDIPVQIIPEPRTNRVFAMGRPVDLLIVEGLIREFDIETSEKTFLRRKLKFVTVSDFLPIAENALNRAFTSTGEGTAGSAAGGAARGNTRPNSSTTPGAGSNTRSSGSGRNSNSGSNSFAGGTSSFGNSGNSSGSGGSGSGSALGNPNANTAPESRLVGRTLLVADNITNSIVVQGAPSGLEIISRLLDQIDVKADQVMISTVIGQLELTDTKSLGLEYLNLGGDVLGRGGAALGPILPLDRVTPFTPGTLGALGGLQLYGKIGDNFHIYMNALQRTNKFTVLARPSIYTANNQKGVISTGQRISIPTANNTYGVGASGTVSTQYQYQDVVLKLEVIPLINSEKEITLQIALVDDEVQAVVSAVAAAQSSNNGTPVPPTITTREILTTVTIPNNETIVLGGLIITKNTDNVSGIPVLSSIPYLGRLFSSTTKIIQKSELLIFIQPSIVTGRESLDFVQSEMDRRYKVTNNVRQYGAGTDSLPVPDKSPPTRAKSTPPPKAKPVDKSRQPQPAK
jgi:type II secretion system protein D